MTFSNVFVSILRKVTPTNQIPVFVILITPVVIVGQMKAYLPAMYQILGIFVSLIVVNCIVILGQAAYKNSLLRSAFDGLGIEPAL